MTTASFEFVAALDPPYLPHFGGIIQQHHFVSSFGNNTNLAQPVRKYISRTGHGRTCDDDVIHSRIQFLQIQIVHIWYLKILINITSVFSQFRFLGI